jgi:competence protein ComEC
MEAYFLDVGQGMSNVILVGAGRALVIDTGRRASDLLQLLHHLKVVELPILALSHLDDDHAGGAPGILTEFRKRIGKICYPNDHRVRETPFWKKLWSEVNGGHLGSDQLVRLEYEKQPKAVWRSPTLKAELKLFSPTFGQNQVAMAKADTNATSGVLVLKVGDNRRIVFPGDSSLEQWQEIRKQRGSSLLCDIASVPHHAGLIWPSHWTDARARAELKWLYTDAMRPRYAIVSVGTSNTDLHPRPEVMDTLRQLGIKILCTQITGQCYPSLEDLRPGVLPLLLPGRARAAPTLTASGNSRDVACAGTIVAVISPTRVSVRRFAQHQSGVDAIQKKSGRQPLCRS